MAGGNSGQTKSGTRQAESGTQRRFQSIGHTRFPKRMGASAKTVFKKAARPRDQNFGAPRSSPSLAVTRTLPNAGLPIRVPPPAVGPAAKLMVCEALPHFCMVNRARQPRREGSGLQSQAPTTARSIMWAVKRTKRSRQAVLHAQATLVVHLRGRQAVVHWAAIFAIPT